MYFLFGIHEHFTFKKFKFVLMCICIINKRIWIRKEVTCIKIHPQNNNVVCGYFVMVNNYDGN